MTEDNRVALVEALSKLGLGTLLAGILASVIWFNHTEQSIINKTLDKATETQIKLLTTMEKNQDIYIETFNKYADHMERTSEAIERKLKEK